MRVRDAMAKTFSTASADDTVEQVAEMMAKEDCGFMPVVDQGRLAGVVTDRDIVIRCLGTHHGDVMTETARQVMTPGAKAIGPDNSLEDAAHQMAESHVRRLPVMEGERLVGVLSHGNLVQAMRGQGCAIEATVGVTEGA
jgi:CBS domain-containing protein